MCGQIDLPILFVAVVGAGAFLALLATRPVRRFVERQRHRIARLREPAAEPVEHVDPRVWGGR